MHIIYYSNDKVRYIGDEVPLDTNTIYKGKTYWKNGKIMYDGTYCNNCKHGNGKEFWTTGILNYDGEWKDDKRHGYGRLYYESGELWYDGHWFLNENCGNGTEYNKNGKIIYSGYWKDGLYNGKGMLYKDDIVYYEGIFVNGQIEGHSVKYNEKGNVVYNGEYLNGMMHGKGQLYNNNGIMLYDGMFTNNEKNGEGKEYSIYGDLMYEGGFMKNRKFGTGTRYIKGSFDSEGKYTGDVKIYNEKGYITYYGKVERGLKHGSGTFIDKDGKTYTGEWKNGKKNGNGVLRDTKKKTIFEGEFVNNSAIKGKWYTQSNGKLSYEGVNKGSGVSYTLYKKNNTHAEVVIFNDNGKSIYRGLFNIETKQREGHGKAYDTKGHLIYEGNFKNDMYNGKGKEYMYIYEKSDHMKIVYEGNYENGVRTNGKETSYKNGRKVKTIAYSHEKVMREKKEANIKLGKRKKADEDDNTPVDFRCPISHEIMTEPVVCSDGNTYDKESIDLMFKMKKFTSPITREKINKTYIPNITLKKLINDYIEKMM